MADTQTQLQSTSVAQERIQYAPPDWVVVGTASHAACTATAAAVTGKINHLYKMTVSFNLTVATACTITVKDGTTVIFQAEVPLGTVFPLNFDFVRPLRSSIGAALVGGCSDAGASVGCTISISGFTTFPT